jgi:hypothetical protein
MNWQNILKNQKYNKGKKDILNGLSILQQNITPNMLERTRSGPDYIEFNLDKEIDGFYFSLIRLKTNMDWLGSFNIWEDIVSIIKELKDSDLRDWNRRGFTSFVISNSSNVEGVEEIDIDMRRKGK